VFNEEVPVNSEERVIDLVHVSFLVLLKQGPTSLYVNVAVGDVEAMVSSRVPRLVFHVLGLWHLRDV
jgi:hypothetical protein